MYFGIGTSRNNRGPITVRYVRSCSYIKAEPGELSDAQMKATTADFGTIDQDEVKRKAKG